MEIGTEDNPTLYTQNSDTHVKSLIADKASIADIEADGESKGRAAGINEVPTDYVALSGDQTIQGTKYFSGDLKSLEGIVCGPNDNVSPILTVKNNFIAHAKPAEGVEYQYSFPDSNGTIALTSDLDAKQDTLVSGTNIKTVNGNSLLGSGNIEVSASTQNIYRHTIQISSLSTASVFDIFTMTVYTKDNTVIDSLTDLFTYLGNTEVAGFGISRNQTETAIDRYYFSIHIGTAATDTYFVSVDAKTATPSYETVYISNTSFTYVTDSVTTL